MPHYVYIIKSLKDSIYSKGYTEDFERRIIEQNEGLSQFTSAKCPWILVYVELHPDKRSALIRERKLKKCKKEYFEWLILQPSNLMRHEP
ncbi:GIY-YIG nuclease family protein [Niabella sp. CJ426]|uniref:GIY-YIG nuclease family protein n=1 Tax=Niabella sp. CJ426 TaxID=3393740 RepID=UPI003D00BFC2